MRRCRSTHMKNVRVFVSLVVICLFDYCYFMIFISILPWCPWSSKEWVPYCDYGDTTDLIGLRFVLESGPNYYWMYLSFYTCPLSLLSLSSHYSANHLPLLLPLSIKLSLSLSLSFSRISHNIIRVQSIPLIWSSDIWSFRLYGQFLDGPNWNNCL